MGKKTACFICSFFILVINGCAIKQYDSPNEFHTLSFVEQKNLCQEWKEILPRTEVRTYYSVKEPPAGERHKYDMQGAEMRAAAANLGSAVAAAQLEKNKRRARKNIEFCTARHFSSDLPEGYSFYFGTQPEGIEYLRSDVDALNKKATQLALDKKFKSSIDMTNRALKKQKNPYSYKIQAATYILAAINEQNAGIKKQLLKKSIESSTKVITTYIPNVFDYFLRGIAYYALHQHEKAFRSIRTPVAA